MNKVIRLTGALARDAALRRVREAPEGYVVSIREGSRSLDQNAAMWPILDAFSEQLEWPVNGRMCRISAEDWKDILTCAFRNEVPRVAQGLDGGMVLLGQRTSRFGKKEFSEWLEFLWATAAERGVTVRETSDEP
jgi:hypothetical protein